MLFTECKPLKKKISIAAFLANCTVHIWVGTFHWITGILRFTHDWEKKMQRAPKDRLWLAHPCEATVIVAIGNFTKALNCPFRKIHKFASINLMQHDSTASGSTLRRPLQPESPMCGYKGLQARAFAWACSRAAVSLCENCVAMERAVRPRCSSTRERREQTLKLIHNWLPVIAVFTVMPFEALENYKQCP